MKVEKKDIRSLSLAQLEEFFLSINEKKYRAAQIYEWLWKKSAIDFDSMTNLNQLLRDKLKQEFDFYPVSIHKSQKSLDGTIKNAIELFDKKIVESVLIPTEKRITACISSQVGCSLDCTFCATAQLERMRNLTVGEIVDQVVTIDTQAKQQFNMPLTNIVFMGMGEPLLNYTEVVKAIQKITAGNGLNMAPKRITVSTSGIPKMIKKLADENLKVNLALSLHSAIEKKRNEIMPFSVKFSLVEIMESLQYWYEKTKNKVTFEYVVWKNFNDKTEDINALVNYAKKVPSKVNIIEYNSIGEEKFQNAEEEIIHQYVETLAKNKIQVNVRKSRGKDIDAACGQLANKTQY